MTKCMYHKRQFLLVVDQVVQKVLLLISLLNSMDYIVGYNFIKHRDDSKYLNVVFVNDPAVYSYNIERAM